MPWTPVDGQQRRSRNTTLADVAVFCTHPFAHILVISRVYESPAPGSGCALQQKEICATDRHVYMSNRESSTRDDLWNYDASSSQMWGNIKL